MSFGHCERYGWFKGFMDDVSKTNVVLKNRVSVTILSIYIYILHEISGQIHLIKNVFPVLSLVTQFLSTTFVLLTSSMNPLNHPYLSQCPKDISAERISMFPEQKLKF
jgi:hypothetical protein